MRRVRQMLWGLALVCALLMFFSSATWANLGHWRYVPAKETKIYERGASEGQPWGFAPFPDVAEQCIERVEVSFDIPDISEVNDIVYQFEAGQGFSGTHLSLVCVDTKGEPIFQVANSIWFTALPFTTIPRVCVENQSLRLRLYTSGVGCIVPLRQRVAVRSHYRPAEMLEVYSDEGRRFARCDGTCRESMRQNDGVHAFDRVCASRQAQYSTRDYHFSTPDFRSSRDAVLEMATSASRSGLAVEVSCVHPVSGIEVGLGRRGTDAQQQRYRAFDVPRECLKDSTTVFRLRALGDGCAWIDQLSLVHFSDLRARYPNRYLGQGECAAPHKKADDRVCKKKVSLHDGVFDTSFLCNGPERAPAWMEFRLHDYATVKEAYVAVKTRAGDDDSAISVRCVDQRGSELATVAHEQPLMKQAQTLWFKLPLACVRGHHTWLEFRSTGSGCISLDYARVYSVSDEGVDRDIPGVSLATYANKRSVRRGGSLDLYVHSTWGNVSIEVVRFGNSRERMLRMEDVPAFPQRVNVDAYKNGAGFTDKVQLKIPLDWKPGMYGARVGRENGPGAWAVFAVTEPDLQRRSKTAVLLSSNTWNAYNRWGGANFYVPPSPDEGSIRLAEELSFDRPNLNMTPGQENERDYHQTEHYAGGETWLYTWLENQKLDYDVLAAEDLDRKPNALAGYANLVISIHSEYWTGPMRDALDRHLARGGSVAYLGGNGVYWKNTILGDRLECRKRATNHFHDGTRGGLWRYAGRPEARVLGVRYDDRGYGTTAPYRVLAPDHPLFFGTQVKQGDLIGEKGRLSRYGVGASGWETDKMDRNSPAHAELLARGTNPNNGGADLVYVEKAGGGAVLSVGSMTYVKSLGSDPTLDLLTRNFLTRSIREMDRVAPMDGPETLEDCAQGRPCVRKEYALSEAQRAAPLYLRFAPIETALEDPIDVFCRIDNQGTERWIGTIYPEERLIARPMSIREDCLVAGQSLVIEARGPINSDALTLDLLALRQGAKHPLRSILKGNHCEQEALCVEALRAREPGGEVWIACSEGNNGAKELSNPSVFEFSTQLALSKGTLVLQGRAAGQNGVFDVECVDAAFATIATLASNQKMGTQREEKRWKVPEVCRDAATGQYRILIRRTGSNCIAADSIHLEAG